MLTQRGNHLWRRKPLRKVRSIALLALSAAVALSGCDRVKPTVETNPVTLPVVAAAFSDDATRLVVGAADLNYDSGAVCVLDTKTGSTIASTYPKHRLGRVRCLAICPDKSAVWVGTGAVFEVLAHDERPTGQCYSGGGSLVLLDMRTLEKRTSLDVRDTVNGLALLPDGKTLAVLTCARGSTEEMELAFWDTQTRTRGKPVTMSGHTYRDHSLLRRMLAISPDGKLLAIALGKKRYKPAEVLLWDVQKNARVGAVSVPIGPPNWVSFSCDGSELAVASSGGLIIAEVKSSQVKFPVWDMLPGAVEGVPGHSHLYVGGPGGKMTRVFLLEPSRQRYGLQFEAGHMSRTDLLSLAVSPDGKLLAAGDFNGSVYIWRIPKP